MMPLADAVVIPNVDPLGLPGPPQLFVALQLLTMLLHVLFMNFVLGGSILAVGLNVAALLGRESANRTATVIYQMMPAAISMTITMGVAPLLFVQVLYGPFFYSANVLLGFAWFSFAVVLAVGFYLSYWLTYRGSSLLENRLGAWDDKPLRRLPVGLLATCCFLYVAWILTNNHELSTHPELWARDGKWASGSRWYVPSPTTLPRYLHNVMGATINAGIWIGAIGWWRIRRGTGDEQANFGMVRFGLIASAALTTVQIGVGAFFLFSLDRAVLRQLLGFQTWLGGVWTCVLLLAVALPMLLVIAAAQIRQFKWFLLSAATAVVVLIGMLMGHEAVRHALLGNLQPQPFTLDQWPVYVQPISILLFAAFLVGGLAVVGLLLYWVASRSPNANHPPPDTNSP